MATKLQAHLRRPLSRLSDVPNSPQMTAVSCSGKMPAFQKVSTRLQPPKSTATLCGGHKPASLTFRARQLDRLQLFSCPKPSQYIYPSFLTLNHIPNIQILHTKQFLHPLVNITLTIALLHLNSLESLSIHHLHHPLSLSTSFDSKQGKNKEEPS